MRRIVAHPVLDPLPTRREVGFRFDGATMVGLEGETIAAALFANGITRFSEHRKGGAPQGIFCANGQCSQCTVIVDGRTLVANTTLLVCDEREVLQAARASSQRVWEAFPEYHWAGQTVEEVFPPCIRKWED